MIFIMNKWVIMDKNRKVIVKGGLRNRYLISVDNEKDYPVQRILYYDSKGLAEGDFKYSGGFILGSSLSRDSRYELEAVQVKITIETLDEK